MAPFSSCEGIDLELFDVQQTNGKNDVFVGCLSSDGSDDSKNEFLSTKIRAIQ